VAKILQHQIIEEALHLIAEEEHWTRCSMARNSEGDPCSVWDPAAVRFCAVGALWRAANELTATRDAFALVDDIGKQVVEINHQTGSLQMLSDLKGHAAVVQMFRTALAA
jgi:hypothetical protein